MRNALVMVVEDDEDLQETLADVFSLLGYDYIGIHRKPNGAGITLRGCPDLLLVDQMLNGEADGVEFTARMKERGLTCPVIAFSASKHMLEAAEESGLFDACLAKPFDLMDCAALVKRLIPGESDEL